MRETTEMRVARAECQIMSLACMSFTPDLDYDAEYDEGVIIGVNGRRLAATSWADEDEDDLTTTEA